MKRPLALVGSVIFVALLGSAWMFETDIHRFFLNAQKYTEQNIPKNSGWKRKVLTTLKSVSQLYPDYPLASIEQGLYFYNNSRLSNNMDFASLTNPVATTEELKLAIKQAQPGDIIVLLPGNYDIDHEKLDLTASGTAQQPIRLTTLHNGDAVLRFNTMVGIQVQGQYWTIENLVLEGVCDFDNKCEHALHIKGDADHLTVINNDFINFNAHIKSNGELYPIANSNTGETQRLFPDYVNISNNRFINQWIRDTKSPVTPLDIVGGDHWTVDHNFIADFAKEKGNKVSYGAFLKGGGEHGIFEANTIMCEWQVPYTSVLDVRVGLSFGGGGTGAQFCKNNECRFEHKDGLLVHNIITNCKNDVSIYINNGSNIKIEKNYLLNSFGIDVNYASQGIVINNNYIHGKIRARDEQSQLTHNNNEFYGRNDNALKDTNQ